MYNIKAATSSVIKAPPGKVYTILADYHNGHPKILPDQFFSDYKVEHGGIGAGTIIRFRTHLVGQSRTIRMEVSEPEPGRILMETDLNTGFETTFTLEPLDNGRATSVTIETIWSKSGVTGFLERFTAPPLLRKIYNQELKKLASLAENAEKQLK